MKNAKRLIALALLLALSLIISACGAKKSTGAPHKVYFIAKSTETEFWQAAFAGANAAKSEYNLDLTICGPETEEDYQSQNEYIRQAVDSGAQAIVFSAISYTDNAAAIDAAVAAGVKVAVIDSDVASPGVSVRIGTDNVEAGRMAAAAALDTDLSELVVGIVNYDTGSKNGQEREAGFREVAQTDPRVKEIYTINVLTTQEEAKAGTMRLLREHPEINVVLGLNEPLAVGVSMAVSELGLAGRMRAVVFDTNVRCIDLLQSGAVTALIVQNPYAMGYLGVETACKLLDGAVYDSAELMDTATTIVTRETMFTIENQKALFPFG